MHQIICILQDMVTSYRFLVWLWWKIYAP